MRRLAAIALVAVACGAVVAHAQTLSLAYAKGATYHYTLHTTSNLSTDMGTVSAPVKMDMTAKEAVTVNSVDSKGVADVSQIGRASCRERVEHTRDGARRTE